MSKLVIINCSARKKNSRSEFMLNKLNLLENESEYIYLEDIIDSEDKIIELFSNTKWVMGMPLYIESISAKVIEFLSKVQQLSKGRNLNITIYPIINGAFIKAEKSTLAIEMMKIFCTQCNFQWGGALAIGGSFLITTLDEKKFYIRRISRNLNKDFKDYKNRILENAVGGNIYTTYSVPLFLFLKRSKSFWKKAAKVNGVVEKDINRCPY